MQDRSSKSVRCDGNLEIRALPGVPLVKPGDDLAVLVQQALARARLELRDSDVIVVASKVVSRAEGRFFDLAAVEVSERAATVARETEKDPRLVELILRESAEISRKTRGVLVTRHRLGFIGAHASIDCSNAVPEGAAEGTGPWALLLPEAPDRAAEQIRVALLEATKASVGVIISDSLGRPFRLGTVGAAIGLAGVPALWDRRGEHDLFGRVLEMTITGLGDQIAAAADLVAGQANEGRAFVLVRGLSFTVGEHSASELLRPAAQDLYA